MEYITTADGTTRRVHREYVGVVVRFERDGSIEPVTVCWKDGRSFPVDEVLTREPFGPAVKGRQNVRYRVRFGGHETSLFLERTAAGPGSPGEGPGQLRWWVYAYDQVLSKKLEESGRARPAGGGR